jgi:hypothetical protein
MPPMEFKTKIVEIREEHVTVLLRVLVNNQDQIDRLVAAADRTEQCQAVVLSFTPLKDALALLAEMDQL